MKKLINIVHLLDILLMVGVDMVNQKIFEIISQIDSLHFLLKQELASEELYSFDKSCDSEFITLSNLFKSDCWPKAIGELNICDLDSEDDKVLRSDVILDTFDLSAKKITGKRVLDFGCGEGHMLSSLVERGVASATGFDINCFDRHPSNNFFIVNDWQTIQKQVEKNGKYDIVILHDVVDHLVGDLDSIMNSISKICYGLVYVRCHPFCSRHGFHLYRQANKAFSHLVFDKEELSTLGIKEESYTHFVEDPVKFYSNIFSKFFKILEFNITRTPVEDFFNQDIIKKRIIKNWCKNQNSDIVFEKISCSFLDFVLVSNDSSYLNDLKKIVL